MKIFYLFLYLYLSCAFFVSVLSNIHFITQSTAASLKRHFSDICYSETFYHDYMKSNKELEPVKNSWNIAKVNETATLNRLCLQTNGLPVTRKCKYDPEQGAVWEPMDNKTRVQCIEKTNRMFITSELNELHKTFMYQRSEMLPFEKQNVIREILKILHKEKYSFLAADVYLTTQILHDIIKNSNDSLISKDVMKVCNTVMSIDDKVLCLAARLNSTNKILKDFEDYMNGLPKQFVPSTRCDLSIVSKNSSTLSKKNVEENIETIDLSYIGVYAHLTANLSIFFINPECANITGIAIYDQEITNSRQESKILYKSLGNFFYRFVYSNESTNALKKEYHIQVATFIPEKLWQYIKEKLPNGDRSIVVKVYDNDSLFVPGEEMETCKPSSKIISISIPGFSGRFPENLPFLVRNTYKGLTQEKRMNAGTGCGYWNYTTWLKGDIETNFVNENEELVLCSTKHLTQFSFLVGGQYKRHNLDEIQISPKHRKALDIISITGCTLSLLGLFGIWITAALFKFWRSLSSTKVLLNMCFVLTLEMILCLLIPILHTSRDLIKEHSYKTCIALGAFLHYIFLVLFTWMLLIAFLQFQRYVTIIGIERPRRFILKSAIIAWGLPLVPTLMVLLLDYKGYIPKNPETGACYPSGYGLLFGVIFPVSIICIANLAIFICVFHSISHTLNQSTQRHEKLMVVRQIRLSILLFFLLGICWTFGIFVYLGAGLIFSYLFCLTATLQGFVLFLYFVVFNDTVRRAWYQLICSVDQKPKKIVREMQSITASTDLGSVHR